MLDLSAQALGPQPVQLSAASLRRQRDEVDAHGLSLWYELMLDEIDYGVLLLDGDAQVLHLNHAARCELDREHPLQLLGRQLRTRDAADMVRLHDALQAASHRGLRRLLMLGQGDRTVAAAVVPLCSHESRHRAIQLSMGKRQLCAGLGVQWFARNHGLTLAETRVLEALSEGLQPDDIATRHRVGLATIRSQISSIRQKTRSDSIGALVRLVAVLPPLVGALRRTPEVGAAQPLVA